MDFNLSQKLKCVSSTSQVHFRSERLRVRTTVIERILKGDLDAYSYLKILEIEANHKLKVVEPGSFRNLTNLEQLSISYNTLLFGINQDTFEGLTKLQNLTLVNNGFNNILKITPAFRPSILPALIRLDLSENAFESIHEETFFPMNGTTLQKLEINLCRLDLVHKNSLNALTHLDTLSIADNDLSARMIEEFLLSMIESGIELLSLDLSGIGFRKQPPKHLMEIIGNSTITSLNLARNQFEIIENNAFPIMKNIELMDLRKVLSIQVGPYVFNPITFPKLKILLLSGNNLPGIHKTPVSNQLQILDLSDNKGSASNPMYYEIDGDTFIESKELIILNIGFNRLRSIFNYTFRGLENLELLNMENGTVYHIGDGSFRPLKRLLVLNLANNPLEANQNLTCAQFEGLNELQQLSLENCGIKRFYDDDNIFETMPNLTNLILRNNQLSFITAETIKPLKFLKILDLSQNLITSWWKPLFLASGIKPLTIYLTNNKISHFSLSMVQDISYLLENRSSSAIEINLMDNIFICDCSAMYKAYRWLQVNGTESLKHFFYTSKFKCSNPDLWEDRRVADYLWSIKTLHCLMYEKMSSVMVLVWTAPSLVTIALVVIIIFIVYKYRMYIRYWMFLAKIALGRNVKKNPNQKALEIKRNKYDAFVSYCNDDRDFVTRMTAELENNPPYLKLCVYERDFEIGSFISEAVQTSISQSRYILLVISNSFAKSQWCRWETQLAEYHRIFLEDGTSYDPLVLIRIGELQSKYLSNTLKFLLKTKIYHSWDEMNEDDFWRKLRTVLAK